MKTPAQRKAEQRARDRAAGLVEILVKVPASDVDRVRNYTRKLMRKHESH